jgi:hypothetical protein
MAGSGTAMVPACRGEVRADRGRGKKWPSRRRDGEFEVPVEDDDDVVELVLAARSSWLAG